MTDRKLKKLVDHYQPNQEILAGCRLMKGWLDLQSNKITRNC